jgi:KDO2-lipid IV(A) lauroyltransferase
VVTGVVGRLIVFVLSSVAWIYCLSPAWLRVFTGKLIGFILGIFKPRAYVVEQNLAIAFPQDKDSGIRARIRQSAYEHLGHLFFEVAMVFGPLKRFVAANVVVKGLENWKAANEKGVGVIFLSSHVGCWEIMAGMAPLSGIDLLLVTKRLKPAWFHTAIEKGRARCGYSATYEPRTMKDILAYLKRGKTVGFVLDQYAGPPVGVRVPVFGQPVGTNSIVAMMAKRTGAEVLPVVNYRDGKGGFVIEIGAPAGWIADESSAKELALNTANYARLLEGHILAHPEQWLWIHKRFKGDLSPLRENEWAEGRVRR